MWTYGEKAVQILGITYSITYASKRELPKRFDDCDGETDEFTKEIFVNDQSDDEGVSHTIKNKSALVMKDTRHELIHAFLCESGLAENSDWAQNEEVVDWIARQFPKLFETFKN